MKKDEIVTIKILGETRRGMSSCGFQAAKYLGTEITKIEKYLKSKNLSPELRERLEKTKEIYKEVIKDEVPKMQ